MNVHQQLLMLALGMLLAENGVSKPVRLHKSMDYGHHVTIEERADYYLIRADVRVDLPPALFEAGANQLEVKLLTSEGGQVNRKAPLKSAKEIWRFYFKAPKRESASKVKYGLVAKVDRIPGAQLAVWEMQDNKIFLGSEKEPLTVKYQVEVPVTQEIAPGEFKVNRIRETRVIGNDYKALPTVEMSSPNKRLPRSIRDDAMTVRLSPR